MAILNTNIDKQETEQALATAIMQLDAMISVVCTSEDFSMKDEKIRDNYLSACAEKIDLIRTTTSELIPELAASLTY